MNGGQERTSEHVRQLKAPTKSDDDLLPRIVTHDEPVRVREDIRELSHASARSHTEGVLVRGTYGFDELVPEWTRTYELVHG